MGPEFEGEFDGTEGAEGQGEVSEEGNRVRG